MIEDTISTHIPPPLAAESDAIVTTTDTVTLADLQPQPVEWLWQHRLAAGTLAMLSGGPGSGKTWVALAIAAAMTTGRAPYTGDKLKPCTSFTPPRNTPPRKLFNLASPPSKAIPRDWLSCVEPPPPAPCLRPPTLSVISKMRSRKPRPACNPRSLGRPRRSQGRSRSCFGNAAPSRSPRPPGGDARLLRSPHPPPQQT